MFYTVLNNRVLFFFYLVSTCLFAFLWVIDGRCTFFFTPWLYTKIYYIKCWVVCPCYLHFGNSYLLVVICINFLVLYWRLFIPLCVGVLHRIISQRRCIGMMMMDISHIALYAVLDKKSFCVDMTAVPGKQIWFECSFIRSCWSSMITAKKFMRQLPSAFNYMAQKI